MALSRDVVIRLLGDADSAIKAQQDAAKAADVTVQAYRRAEREMDRQAKAAATAARQQQEAMQGVGRAAMGMGAVVAAGLALSTKAAIDWESAWAGVRKTVDGSPQEMAALERELRNLATTLPATHEEIAGVAEAAGQLGIARGDIVEFTKVAVAMGVSTNLSAEEASTGMAQMMNVMGTASSDVDRLGSTLVALGNAGASTEAEILSMSQRIAGAGNIIGASESDVLALSNTLASLGINAELGGGAMTRVLLKINTAMMEGGETAEGFARVAGMSAQEFATAWRQDPMAAVAAFTDGLGRVKDSGGNVVTTLNDLGIAGSQNMQVMLGLAGANGQLSENLALGNKAWAENNALMNEANQRYETTASRLQVARNQINDAAIDIGGTLLPVLATGAEMVANFARGFEMLPGPAKEAVTIIGALAAVVGLVGGAAIVAAPKLVAFRSAMATLEASSSAATRNVGRFGMLMTGPWGAAIGLGVTLLGTLVTALGASSRASEEAAGYQRDLASALRESRGAIDDNIRALAAQQAEEANVSGSSLLEWAERIGVELPVATDALLGQRDAVDEVSAAFEAYAQAALDAAVANGTADTFDPSGIYEARDAFVELAGGMGGAVAENERLAAAEKTQAEASGEATGAAQGLLSGLEGVAGAAGGAAEGVGAVGGAAAGSVPQIDEATQAILDWRGELQKVASDFVDPLNAYKGLLDEKTEAERKAAEATAASTKDASDSWEDYVGDVDVSLNDLADRLQEQIETQQNWRANVVRISQRGGDEVAQAIAAMGEEGVELAAEMANGSDKEFKRMARLLLRDVEQGGEGWTAEMDTAMRVMARVGRQGANTTADAIAKELGIGVDEVERIAKEFGVELAQGVNPIIGALGRSKIDIATLRRKQDFYAGGYTGPGGKYEPAGVVHRGEFVVPSEKVNALGGPNRIASMVGMPGYAAGGFVTASDVPKPPSMGRYQRPMSTAGNAATGKMYDEVRDYVEKNAVSMLTGGTFGRSGGSSPNGIGGLGPVAAAARQYVMQAFGLSNIGGYSYRNIAGTNTLSDHATGHAIDVMIPNYRSAAGIAKGNAVASYFVNNASKWGVKYVIWRDRINSGGGWGPYGHPGGFGDDTSQHRDHDHISFYRKGTPFVPTDRLAYLHRGERVIPAEQNRTWLTQPRLPVNSGGGASVVNNTSRSFAPVVNVVTSERMDERALLSRIRDLEFLSGG